MIEKKITFNHFDTNPRFPLFYYIFGNFCTEMFFVAVSVLYIVMSVNIVERPTFERRAFHFDRGVFSIVICLVLIFT